MNEKNNEEIKKARFKALVVYGICALIWIGKTTLEIIYKDYITHPKLIIADIICTIWFIFIFILWCIKYKYESDMEVRDSLDETRGNTK